MRGSWSLVATTPIYAHASVFPRQPGRYVVSVQPSSPQKFNQVENSFEFELTDVDLDNLKNNIPYIDLELKNIVNSNLSNPEPHPIQWQWANVQISRDST
jgi:hypothetical protein